MNALLLLAGCFTRIDASSDDVVVADDVERAATCTTTVDATVPTQGAVDAYYRGAVEFHLSEPDPTATVRSDVPGVQSTRDGGRVVVFTPAEPLEPRTDYAFTLDYCHGSPDLEFRTSELGAPLGATSDLVGATYSFDPASARYLAGESVGQLASGLFGQDVLVGLVSVDEGRVALRIAVAGDDGAQDFCARTLDLPAADFMSAPYFDLQADSVAFDAWQAGLTLWSLTAGGTFSADGTTLGGVAITSEVDTREVAAVLGSLDSEGLCALAGTLGAPCQTCAGDGDAACVVLEVDQLVGERIDGTLEAVVDADADARCVPVE